MFKHPLNPKAIELIKSSTDRSISLDQIEPLILNGLKLCAWCYTNPTKGPKYCGRACSLSARANFYPQKEESLFLILAKQEFKCANCKYDWEPLILQLLINGRVYDKPNDYRIHFSYWLMRRIKSKSPKEHKPEIDHILPIYKGGLPLNIDNLNCLCYSCHKTKTKSDLSGKRPKKEKP